jgi:hypothetical protein
VFQIVGRLETRLPFLAILIPESIRARCPNAVRMLTANTQRLVTAYDLHATQMAIANGTFCTDETKDTNVPIKRGYSLFNELANPSSVCVTDFIRGSNKWTNIFSL